MIDALKEEGIVNKVGGVQALDIDSKAVSRVECW